MLKWFRIVEEFDEADDADADDDAAADDADDDKPLLFKWGSEWVNELDVVECVVAAIGMVDDADDNGSVDANLDGIEFFIDIDENDDVFTSEFTE